LFFDSSGWIKFNNIFPVGDINFVGTGDYVPGIFTGKDLLFRIYFSVDDDIFLGKNRPGFCTGNSSFAHISPSNVHTPPLHF